MVVLILILIGLPFAPGAWATYSAKREIAQKTESPVTGFRNMRRHGDLVCGEVATETHPDYRNFWVSHGSISMLAPDHLAGPEVFIFWFDNWNRCQS